MIQESILLLKIFIPFYTLFFILFHYKQLKKLLIKWLNFRFKK
jgi:hypothetical protein